MKSVFLSRIWLALAGIFSGVSMFAPVSTSASSFFYFFNDAGATAASSPSDFPISIHFEDVSPGVVNIEIVNNGLTGTENVRRLYLNLNPQLDPASLNFTMIDGSDNLERTQISQKANGKHVSRAGNYDLGFKFKTSKHDRFGAGDFITYQVSGIPNLSATDFVDQSSERSGDQIYYSAGRLNPGSTAGFKGWIFSSQGPVPISVVPEPSPSLLIAAGGLLLMARRYFQTSHQS